MHTKEQKPVKASSIRRSISTLVKAGIIKPEFNTLYDNQTVMISMIVSTDLIQKKNTIRKSQTKKTKT